jgi:hypothetical protein
VKIANLEDFYQHFGGPQRDNASLSHGAGGDGIKVRRKIKNQKSKCKMTN